MLGWARETQVSEVAMSLTSESVNQMKAELELLVDAAKQLGVPGQTLVEALAAYRDSGGIPNAVAETIGEKS